MLNSSYNCHNFGQKCRCESDCTKNFSKTDYHGSSAKKSVCTCTDVNVIPEYSIDDCDDCQSKSFGSCICTYGKFAIRIDKAAKNCSALEKSLAPNSKKFDACPYREGKICECKRNPNTGKKQCFCRDTLKRIPPFSLRSNPIECCNDVSDCIDHSELYCYCTNYKNNTHIKMVSRSALAKLPKEELEEEFGLTTLEKLCNTFGHHTGISCHPFGYKGSCFKGFCNLKPVNLYYNKIR